MVAFLEFNFPGKCHHRADFLVIVLANVFIKRQLVAHSGFA
ncbi:hypothetical protein HmCmsJML164_01899 [Escherichia coli]|nr:hypothetical protein HmCmsJML164_01899 [Escherichia coli]